VRWSGGILVAALSVCASSCTAPSHSKPLAATTSVTLPATVPSVSHKRPAPRLVRWKGPVEAMFFHPLVLRPRLAFTDDQLGRGFQDFFVTAREFRGILGELWRNGWSLVDPHRVAANKVRVPKGRKPLLLMEDDANYYHYFRGRGLARRLVLDRSGEFEAEQVVGGHKRRSGGDFVPLVEEAVARHPAFSAEGAKGVLALTGYDGLFGERRLDRPPARRRIRTLVRHLRARGWTIASHTFGHITLSEASLWTLAQDTARWREATKGLLGRVDMLVYPYGSRPSPEGLHYLRDQGFRIQFDIDVQPRRVVEDGVVVISRRHVDGLAFEEPQRLARFFSVKRVRDPHRPS
jgi:hypothetical protein